MRGRSSSSVRVRYPRHSREELIRLLREGCERLRGELPLRLVTLFGSWAKGRATAASDVDVLLVYRGPRRGDAYDLALKVFRVRGLELHVMSEEEFERLIGESPRTRREWVEEAIIIYDRNSQNKR